MAAAGESGGVDDLLSPNGENVENRQPLGLAAENAEETSDVSASLFKEISSEEEMEVLSGAPHGAGLDGDILGMNGVGNADSEAETSGEDGSLFEEIGGDDSHFSGLGGVQQSAYDRAANGDNGAAAGYILGGSLRFQTEDVPFIRAARGDLDGPLDGPLASLRREDGASLHTFGEKLSSIFEDLRAKEESSPLAGICRDYGSSSGEEGGADGANVILTDSNREGGQDSLPVKEQEVKIDNVQESVEVLMIPMDQGTNIEIVSGISLGENPEVSILPLTIEGNNPTPLNVGEVADGGVSKVTSSSPNEAPKKRGRASRELGALLLDAKGNGRGRKAAGLQADVSDSFALAVVRGTTEAGAAVDGFVLEPPESLGARVEVRITRSRASGRLAGKNHNLNVNSLDGTVSQDVTAKRTGKRSVPKKGGRLGWGNGHENSADGGLVAGESSVLPDNVLAEGQIGAGLETGEGVEELSKDRKKGPKSKSGGRAKKARGKGKQISSEGGNGQSKGLNVHIEESNTAGITTDLINDLKGLETQSQIDEVLITPPSAGTLTNLEALETGEGVEEQSKDSKKGPKSKSGGRAKKARGKGKHISPEGGNGQSTGLNAHIEESNTAGITTDIINHLKGLETQSQIDEVLITPPSASTLTNLEALETGEGGEKQSKDSKKGLESKSGGRAKKARGKGKQISPEVGNGQSTGLNAHIEESNTAGITTDIMKDLKGLETQSQIDEVLITPPSAGTLTNLEALETEAVEQTKGRAKKRVTTRKNPSQEAAPLVTGDDSVVEAKEKASTASRRGKRKLNSENVVGSVAPSQETSTEPSKDVDVDDMKEPADGNKNVMETPEKAVKSRQKGKSTTGGLEGRAAKKRRKTGKLEDPQLNSDPCSVAVAVNGSTEVPAEGIPVGSGPELKTPQRGKAGQKKSQKAISGRKVAKKTPVGDKSKQPKKPPRATAKSKGATVKVLSTIKDQSSQETLPAKKNKSAKPKVGKSNSKLPAEVPDDCALDDGEAGREEKGDQPAAKKRRKSGKLEDTQLNSDPCSAAMAVNGSTEEPTDGIPIGSGSELKTPQRGKAGQKKSQKAISRKKVTKKAPVGDKSKQPKKPPRATAKSKGATVKVLSTIKDQSSQETVPATENISAKPEVGKSNSKLPAEVTDDCALGDGEAGREGKGEVAVGSAPLNQETDGNVTKAVQSEEVVRDIDGGAVGEDVSSGVTEGGENKGSEKGIDSAGAETGAARKSWVLCDDCNKWRCIPVELADQIESTNARWSCRENPDKEFQDCAVPQEKSNAEINAELQISEVSVCEEGDDKDAVDSKSMNLGAANEDNKPAVWKRIRRNIFQHRRRKVLEIDEMMVCQCTPPEEGGVGCGENCLNRMLSIECVAEQCPCGEACSNQQFQNRTYAPIAMYRCGKKGFGLKVVDTVPKGTFIIEYVGEVLDVSAFEARQQEYARKGQKHFYFMTLNTNEVIDACSKGNFGRFINHSCEPNCRTEKWMVNGEVCVGLFAVRNIAKDEEVTFDYNYVRVCGAAAKKCECGSSQCRGYIGGDPLTPKAVVESDSEDEEDLEPVMVENSEDEDAYVDENKVAPCKKPRAEAEFQETSPVRTVGIKRKLNILKEKVPSVVKRFKTNGSARRSNSGNYKGLTLDISGGRYESPRTIYFSDVQEKLDDMLDRNGGLRKRRDAAKQYLKLLVLTSASGDSRKDATACSVRDLSLLLEALLKTTSRTVLSDIMNKNGLRMLHNLIKQLRRQWDKTPILRKLIKVLDLLASERVLTTDLITSGPPCSGMESFSQSLFELTRHKDTEVVHMVRRFRNKWMPPRIWDEHYRGFEKPFPMQSIQSSSTVVMHQSEQLNMGSNIFQSPQHPKQGSLGSEVSRPGSSEPSWPQGGSLPASQSHNGLACMEEGMKENVKSTLKASEVGEDSTPGMTQPTEKKTRKRPSRWDAPAKVEKTSKGPSDPLASTNQSDAQGADSGKQTTFPVPYVSQGSVQVQFEGSRQISSQAPSAAPQALKQAVGPPVPQSMWPFSTSSGSQDSARLPNGGMSGQLQMGPRDTGSGLHHPHTQLLQGMPPTQHIPGAPTMQMQMGPPSTHVGLQQTPNSNAIQFGPPPLPSRGFPRGPPMQMGPVVPSAQGMHGSTQQVPIGTVAAAPGYPREPRPPPMPPTAPYGQWRPPPGGPNFAVAHSFPTDPSQMHPMPSAWPLQRVDDGAQRVSGSDEVKRNKEANLLAGADAEPEPPVPGLSPRPPPPGEGSTPMVWIDSGSQSCQEFNEMSERGYYQAQWMPPHYMQGQGITQEYYGSRDPYGRDGTLGYPCGEYWETPEGEGFREDVFALVSMRVHKHHKLRTRDLDRFCSKMADVIVRKEVAKYIEHRNQGIEKIIMKTKLIEKVDSYVDNQVGLYLKKIDKSH